MERNSSCLENGTFFNTTSCAQPLFQDHEASYILLKVLTPLGIISLMVDLWAFSAIRKQKGPPSNYSLANLFICSLLVVISTILILLMMVDELTVDQWGFCAGWGIFQRFHMALFSFTIVGIFYEMIHTQKVMDNSWAGSWFKLKTFLCVWFYGLVILLPGGISYGMRDIAGNYRCDKIFILDSKNLYVFYDGLFTICMTVLPVSFMIYALRQVNFQMELLCFCKPIPFGLHEKVWRLRWVFFYVVFFAISSSPFIIIHLLKLRGTLAWRSGSGGNSEQHFYFYMGIRSVWLTWTTLHTLLFLCSHKQLRARDMLEKLPFLKKFLPKKKTPRGKRPTRNENISSAFIMETFAVTVQQRRNQRKKIFHL